LAHNSKQEERKHLFDSIGIWFFAIAILCEIAGYWYGQRNDALSEQVISSLDVKAQNADAKAQSALDKSSTADTKAGEALTKSTAANEMAGKAQNRIGDVEREADIISKKTLRASLQVDALEHQVLVQGPRWVLLERSKDRFVEKLKPLAGTKVTLVNCGPRPPFEQERLLSDLRRLLWPEDGGAGWLVSISTWNSCDKLGFAGNLLVSNRANDGAVNVLFRALLNAGIIAPPDNDMPKDFIDKLGDDSPWVLAAKDPSSIFLVVGINPMVDVEKTTRFNLKNLAKPPK
jgi:hypothetical protein